MKLVQKNETQYEAKRGLVQYNYGQLGTGNVLKFEIGGRDGDGRYPESGTISASSDMVVFVPFGQFGEIDVDGKMVRVRKGDAVLIEKGESYSIRGNLDVVIIEQ